MVGEEEFDSCFVCGKHDLANKFLYLDGELAICKYCQALPEDVE